MPICNLLCTKRDIREKQELSCLAMAFLSYTAKLAVVGASGEWEGRVTLPPSLLMAPRWSKMSYCFLQFSVFRFRFESPQVKRNLIFICKKNFVYEWPGKLPNDGRVSSKMLLN